MYAQRTRGYTLVELLIALSITSILASASISGLSTLIEKTVQRNAIYSLSAALQHARSLAVTTGRRAFVCSINSVDECVDNWQSDHIGVVIDKNGNRIRDADEPVVYRLNWKPSREEITWSNRLHDPSITFQPRGTVVSNGTLTLKDKNGAAFAKLIINNGGRVRLEKL